MTMTGTFTQTFTITNARHVTAKIAADLDLMRVHYGWPTEQAVTDFAEEAAMLLAKRYLGSVEYGAKIDGVVVFALRYTARSDGTLVMDDRPGRVPADLDLAGARFYSWLTYSAEWDRLGSTEKALFESGLPVKRTSGTEPITGFGSWSGQRSYSSNGEGVSRQTFRAA
jgi:hypothetical protein